MAHRRSNNEDNLQSFTQAIAALSGQNKDSAQVVTQDYNLGLTKKEVSEGLDECFHQKWILEDRIKELQQQQDELHEQMLEEHREQMLYGPREQSIDSNFSDFDRTEKILSLMKEEWKLRDKYMYWDAREQVLWHEFRSFSENNTTINQDLDGLGLSLEEVSNFRNELDHPSDQLSMSL